LIIARIPYPIVKMARNIIGKRKRNEELRSVFGAYEGLLNDHKLNFDESSNVGAEFTAVVGENT